MIRDAVEAERTRALKPGRVPQPATDAARELEKMGTSATYANRVVKEMASDLLDKARATGRKQ